MQRDRQRIQYLFKNTAVFTFGNVASKMISFFLVPLYTNTLTTAQFGTADLVMTICSVLAPIFILNIGESVMRFSLDKDADYSKIMSVGLLIYFISFIVGLLIFPINAIFKETAPYSAYMYFNIITSAGCQLLLCYLRGKEKLVEYAFGGVLQTLTLAGFNIWFLIVLKSGVEGYFLAMILSALITQIYAGITGKVWEALMKFTISKELAWQMIRYSIVLIPNTFMWWIMNASDRLMVTVSLGAAANGVYAVSYKLPTLISTVTSIFNQAWSYSAIKEAGVEDETQFNNKVFKTLVSFTMLVGIGFLTFAKPFLRIYVEASYYGAWRYIPFLTIGCVYLTLATFMGTSYTVHKDSWGYLFSATFGAVINILLNLVLIPVIGVYGAAIATGISYISVFTFRAIHTRKYIVYRVWTKEFIVGSFCLILSSVFILIDNWMGSVVQACICLITIIFYANIWLPIIRKWIKYGK